MGGSTIFFFAKTSNPTQGPTEPPVEWIRGFFPGGIAAVA
jgi:hypothetical protein